MYIDPQMTAGTVPKIVISDLSEAPSAIGKNTGTPPGRVVQLSSTDSSQPANGLLKVVAQIGRDYELLRLRAMLIRSAGYIVHSMAPGEAAAELRNAAGAQVWIFCHTLEFYELALLALAIRTARPGDKLLRLTALNDVTQVPGLFDELLEPAKGVDDLLRTVAVLANP